MSDKVALRAGIVARRSALDPALRASLALAAVERLDALPLLREARTVALYAALGAELDPAALDPRLRSRGVRVVYPRIRPGERRLAFAACALADLVRGPRAAREPPASAPEVDPAEVDGIVVPAVAFSEDGLRLGRGGGYYDATLAAWPRALRVGVAFDPQVVPALPHEPHDAAMDAVVTDLRVLTFRREGP